MPQKLNKYILPALLVLLGLLMGLLNFTPGTYLTGWDTLHPEFDYLLNLQRTIFGVFRTEQGLGAVAAHSHMIEIPRIIILWFLDIFLPTNLVRYSYIILTLILGPLGIYYFLNTVLKKEFPKLKFIEISAFSAAVFYMLNPGTLQQFVVPFEMFNTLYAFLPWILLFTLKYIYSSNTEQKKYLLLFAVFTLFASPMAYAPALWHVNFAMLCIFLFILSLPKLLKKDFKIAKKSAILIFITLLINSYWLQPHIYFLLNNSSQVQEALVNKLFSEQAFYYNKAYGDLRELALLKSFLFSWSIYSNDGAFTNLLNSWIQYLNSIFIQATGYLLAIITFIGILYSIFKKKIILTSIFVMLLFTLFFLLTSNPPLGFLFNFIQNNVPLFKEALRFPHTKFFIHYIFIFSVFFSVGILFIANKISVVEKYFAYFYIALATIAIIFFMIPAFQGFYISPHMRIDIPSDYFELSEYLNSRDDMGKVALFPINSFWGWDYHDWGYQGAGFIWFNIKQPVLHRNFDRWAWTNEQFYKEMSYAIYSQDPQKFEQVVSKYDISYVLVDRSIISPENDPKTLFIPETNKLMAEQTKMEKTKTFGKLDLYEVKDDQKDTLYVISNPTSAGPAAKILNEDYAYKNYGDYISNIDTNQNKSFFPFRNLINNESEISNSLYKLSNEGIEFPISASGVNSSTSVNSQLIYADILARRNPDSTRTLVIAPINNQRAIQSGTIEIPIQNPNEVLVNINGSNTFNIPVGIESGTALLLGRARFQTDSNNTISFYNPGESQLSQIRFTSDNFQLRQCDNSLNIDNFGIDFLSNNSFSIFGKNIPLCLTLPLAQVLDPNSSSQNILFGIKYNSEINNDDAPSSICISNLKNGNCISYFTTDFSNTNTNSYFYGLKSEDISNTGLMFFIDTTKNTDPTRATFKNMEVSKINPYASINITGSEIKQLIPNMNNLSEVITYYSGDQRLSKDITELPKTVGSCEINPKFTINEKDKSIDIMDDYIRYTTDDGSLCDSFSYQNLLQNQSYIVLITSRNIEGLPLSICLTNFYSKKCDIYTQLTHSHDFTTQAFLLPPMQDSENGYDINTNNFAVKGTTSINDLKSIVFIPFPYDTAMNLTTDYGTHEKSSVESIEFKNLNPLLFKSAIPEFGDYLTLTYTHDPGWQAYIFKDSNPVINLINYTLPFALGDRLDKKVLVNNWSNGWQINKTGDYILVVYVPQYLEYLGFVLSIGTIIALIYLYLKPKRHRSKN